MVKMSLEAISQTVMKVFISFSISFKFEKKNAVIQSLNHVTILHKSCDMQILTRSHIICYISLQDFG